MTAHAKQTMAKAKGREDKNTYKISLSLTQLGFGLG
jgi:hypothetical protein